MNDPFLRISSTKDGKKKLVFTKYTLFTYNFLLYIIFLTLQFGFYVFGLIVKSKKHGDEDGMTCRM